MLGVPSGKLMIAMDVVRGRSGQPPSLGVRPGVLTRPRQSDDPVQDVVMPALQRTCWEVGGPMFWPKSHAAIADGTRITGCFETTLTKRRRIR